MEKIKEYLIHPPVLTAPISGKPFLIYVRAMDHSLRALLAQNNSQGHEQATYYLNRAMIGAEHRYNPIEKKCLAQVFTIQKKRHYLVGNTFMPAPESILCDCSCKTIILKLQICDMGYFALGVWDAIHAAEGCKRSSRGEFLSWPSTFRIFQTLWWSPRWNRWSLHDPDIIRKINLAIILRWRLKNGFYRKHHSRSVGSTCI